MRKHEEGFVTLLISNEIFFIARHHKTQTAQDYLRPRQ